MRIWCVRFLPSHTDEEARAGQIDDAGAGHNKHLLAPTSAYSDGLNDLSVSANDSLMRQPLTAMVEDHNNSFLSTLHENINNNSGNNNHHHIEGLGVLCGAPTLYRALSQALIAAGSEGIMSETLMHNVALDVKAWQRRVRELIACGEAWVAKEQVGRNKVHFF